MKKLLLILSFLIAITSNAQNCKYSAGIINGIDYYNYSFWGFPPTYTIEGRTEFFPEGNHKFKNTINFSIGLKFEYNTKNISLDMNVINSSKGYKIEYDIPEVNGFPVYKTSYLKFNYNDLNLNVGYIFLKDKKINIVPKLGFTYSMLFKTDNIVELTNDSFTRDKDYTDAYVQHSPEKKLYSINGGISIKIAFGTKIKMILTPYIAQYLNQLAKEPMDRNPTAYGIKYGVVYCFGKSKKED